MLVTREAGQATRLVGDPSHNFTRGFLCQKVSRYLQRVYHTDRLKQPLRRVGAKGTARFEPISWDVAIAEIADRFRAIISSADGPQAILPYSYGGTMGEIQGGSLDRRFFHCIGASLLDRTICATAGMTGCEMTLGTQAFVDPDSVIHARVIINWGSNTAVTNSHLWVIMHRARKLGATIVTIDPYRSPTAVKSDWWLPIRPGADAALALGILHVVYREGWQDQDYIDRYCLGGDQLKQRALNEFAPSVVAGITGLTTSDIERLAQLYARTKPALIRLNYGLQRHRGGGMAVRTICCLPAVIGSWREVGGGALLSTSRMYPWNRAGLQRSDLIPPGTRTINMVQLPESLSGQLSGPPVKALFVYNANPAAVNPDQKRVLQGLARDDLFMVVHDQFLTDTARYADIVLPATTQLEHFDIHGSYGHLDVQVNEPAIAALAEAKCNTDVFRLLARALNLEAGLFDVSDEDLAREALKSQQGALRLPMASAFDGITLERLQTEGPIRLRLPRNFTPFAEGGFNTPSGRCEFFSARMEALGLDPIPNYTPPAEDPVTRPDIAAKFPLQMLSPPHPAILNSTFANVPELQHMAGEAQIELCDAEAKRRGLASGERVRVFNERGSFQAILNVSDNVRPGVAVTLGCRWLSNSPDGANCNATTSTTVTDLGAGGTFFDNLVQVERLVSR